MKRLQNNSSRWISNQLRKMKVSTIIEANMKEFVYKDIVMLASEDGVPNINNNKKKKKLNKRMW